MIDVNKGVACSIGGTVGSGRSDQPIAAVPMRMMTCQAAADEIA
jgi:hypothetical protein